jgi:peptide/nickel transport system ATP-binding protein
MDNILEIHNLRVAFHTEEGIVRALNGVDLELEDGMTLGLVGETGAGKTTLAKTIMKLIPSPPGRIESGTILFKGKDLLKTTPAETRSIRGSQISMIFQDPMSSLNPVITVGDQIAEVIKTHENATHNQAWDKSIAMLETVGIPAERAHDFPHQFSGGMKQRVVIAIALACKPSVLIADEPTTALDVTIQAQVLDMMQELQKANNTATLMITHDMGIVAQTCQKIAILYAGEVLEYGSAHEIFKNTLHPYTEGLLGAIPQMHMRVRRLNPINGLMPDPMNLPSGCVFSTRCKYATSRCREERPKLTTDDSGHKARCFRYEQ